MPESKEKLAVLAATRKALKAFKQIKHGQSCDWTESLMTRTARQLYPRLSVEERTAIVADYIVPSAHHEFVTACFTPQNSAQPGADGAVEPPQEPPPQAFVADVVADPVPITRSKALANAFNFFRVQQKTVKDAIQRMFFLFFF